MQLLVPLNSTETPMLEVVKGPGIDLNEGWLEAARNSSTTLESCRSMWIHGMVRKGDWWPRTRPDQMQPYARQWLTTGS